MELSLEEERKPREFLYRTIRKVMSVEGRVHLICPQFVASH